MTDDLDYVFEVLEDLEGEITMYKLKNIATSADWSDFIDLPWTIYADSPHWVPPLRVGVKDILNINKNPFFR